LGDLKSMRILIMLFRLGKTYLYSCVSVLDIMHSSPFLCVCDDDRITRYPGADDLTDEPGDGIDSERGLAWDFCIYI